MAEDKKPLGGDTNTKMFENMVEQLQLQNEQTKAIKDTAIYSQQLQEKLREQTIDLGSDQKEAIMDLISTLQGNKFDDLEAQKEANETAKKTLELLGDIAENTEQRNKAEDLELEGVGAVGLGIIAGITAAISGLGLGLIAGITDIYRTYLRIIKNGIKSIGKFLKLDVGFKIVSDAIRNRFAIASKNITDSFKGIQKSIQAFFKPLTNGIKNIRLAFAAGFNGLKTFRTVTGQFGKLGFFGTIGKSVGGFVTMVQKGLSFFTKPVKLIGNAFNSIKAAFGGITKSFTGITKGTGAIGKTLAGVGKLFVNVIKVFGAIGRTIGRLFLPLTVVLSVFDTVKGAIEGFIGEEGNFFEKAIAGAIGGMKGLLTGLVAYPLDLLKSGVAWLLEKLGFDAVSEALQSFSFIDITSGIFEKINGFFQAVIGFVGELFTDPGAALQKMADGFSSLVKRIANFTKAIAKGAAAALGALLPGGETPQEAFSKKFKEVMESGRASEARIEQGDVSTASTDMNGQEIDTVSREVDAGKENITRDQVISTVVGGNTTNKGGDTIIYNGISNPDSISESLANR